MEAAGYEDFMKNERERRKGREIIRRKEYDRDDDEDFTYNSEVEEQEYSSDELLNSDDDEDEEENSGKQEIELTIEEEGQQFSESSDEDDTILIQPVKENAPLRTSANLNNILQTKYARRLVTNRSITTLYPESERQSLKIQQCNLRERDLLKKISGPIPIKLSSIAQKYLQAMDRREFRRPVYNKYSSKIRNKHQEDETKRIIDSFQELFQKEEKINLIPIESDPEDSLNIETSNIGTLNTLGDKLEDFFKPEKLQQPEPKPKRSPSPEKLKPIETSEDSDNEQPQSIHSSSQRGRLTRGGRGNKQPQSFLPRQKFKCPVEGCRNNEYYQDNLRYQFEYSSQIKELQLPLEWPAHLLIERSEFPITSRDISTFIVRNSAEDEYAQIDTAGNKLIRRVEHYLANIEQNQINTEALSIMMQFESFPAELLHRSKVATYGTTSSLLRPCLIDGVGISYAYDGDFNPKWKNANNVYLKETVLPMFPLFQTVLRLTLMGHKAQLVLPEYYEEPCFPKQMKPKVDDLFLYNSLKKLNLIIFLKAENTQEFISKIQEISQKDGSAIFTSTQLHKETKPDDSGEFEYMRVTNKMNRIIDIQKRDRMEGNSSERLIGISFHTISKEIIFLSKYMVYIGVDANHKERKHDYHSVEKRTTLFYTDRDGDVRDPEILLANQLRFDEQTKIILTICDSYNLSQFNLQAVQLFLRFAHLLGICKKEFGKFLEEHKPFPFPSELDEDANSEEI